MPNFKDITGQRFGRLVAIERVYPNSPNNHTRWLCRCDCGGEHITTTIDLGQGKVKSCKCAHPVWKNGRNKEHRQNPLYSVWKQMRSRCNWPDFKQFKDYGGRGIKICKEWDDFERFAADVGPRPHPGLTLDRINNNGNYEPGNVRWATRSEQAFNRRPKQKRLLSD